MRLKANMRIAIPSRGRSETLTTAELFPQADIFVPKKEFDLYKFNYKSSNVICADIENETIAKKRNFILDYYKDDEQVIMLDDDIREFWILDKGKFTLLTPEAFLSLAEKEFEDMKGMGVKLFGVYPIFNEFFMKECINHNGFCVGKCMGIIKSELRFDETIKAKEDYDFTLQNIEKFGSVHRLDYITVKTGNDNAKGGCSIYRSKETAKSDVSILLEKHPGMVKLNGKRENEVLINAPAPYSAPRWTGEITDCSMPMTFDTYNLCSYDCQYCFSYFQRSHSSEDYMNKNIRYVNVDRVKKLFRGEIEKSQFNDYIKSRITMQWGGLSDPFDLIDMKLGVTLELLRFFKEINYPLSFSTKSIYMTKLDRYREVIRDQKNWHFKFSIITLDADDARRIEKCVATPQQRLQTIKELRDLGIEHVTLRMRPFIIGTTDKNMEDLVKAAKDSGVDSVTTEFFCLEKRADPNTKARYSNISKVVGFDVENYYRKFSYQQGYARLNYEIKKPYIERLRTICDKEGLRLYVSDAHHKAQCENGSCCGLPCDWNYSRGQFTEALLLAKQNGRVHWKEIDKYMDMFKKFKWGQSEGYNTSTAEERARRKNQTMYDFLHEVWNDPSDGSNPYRYFDKVMYPVDRDKFGDLVYEYNPKRIILPSNLSKKRK